MSMIKYSVLAILLMCLLLPTQGWGQFLPDVHGKGTVGASATSQTESIAVGASATGLWVGQVWQGAVDTSGCTWNGSAMTQKGSTVVSGAGLNVKVALFEIASPATGTHNAVCSWSAATTVNQLFWISVTGGDTGTPSRTASTRSDGDGTGPGITLGDFIAGDIAINLSHVYANTIVFDGGETAQQNDNMAVNGTSAGLSYKTASGTVGATDQSFYAEIAIALVPASAGAVTHNLMMLGVGR